MSTDRELLELAAKAAGITPMTERTVSCWLDDFKTTADGVEWVNSYPGYRFFRWG